jgi:hypothetical protein
MIWKIKNKNWFLTEQIRILDCEQWKRRIDLLLQIGVLGCGEANQKQKDLLQIKTNFGLWIMTSSLTHRDLILLWNYCNKNLQQAMDSVLYTNFLTRKRKRRICWRNSISGMCNLGLRQCICCSVEESNFKLLGCNKNGVEDFLELCLRILVMNLLLLLKLVVNSQLCSASSSAMSVG